jgi:pilin isopeptide linkage protein
MQLDTRCDKVKRRLLTAVLSLLMVLSVFQPAAAWADTPEPDRTGDLTGLYVSKIKDNEPEGYGESAEVTHGEYVFIKGTFEGTQTVGDYRNTFKSGDTITVNLNTDDNDKSFLDALTGSADKPLTITKDGESVQVGTMHVTAAGAVITFNDAVEKYSDVSGDFFFEVRAFNRNDAQGETKEISTVSAGKKSVSVTIDRNNQRPGEFLQKGGSLRNNDATLIDYVVHLNAPLKAVNGAVTFTDQLPEGLHFVSTATNDGWLNFYEHTDDTLDPASTSPALPHQNCTLDEIKAKYPDFSYTVTNHTITITFPEKLITGRQISINYHARVDDEYKDTWTKYTNTATANYTPSDTNQPVSTTKQATVYSARSGANIVGQRGELYIHKYVQNSNTPVEGIVFSVYKEDGSVYKENLTTDENGEIKLTEVPDGKYIVREISVPKSSPVTMDVKNSTEGKTVTFSSTDTAGHELVFYDDVKTTDISGTKTWKGDEDYADTSRPDSVTVDLYRTIDGTKEETAYRSMTVTAETNWSYSFKNLPQYTTDLKEITYSVQERDVPKGYTPAVDGNDITNTIQTEDDQDNAASLKIKKVKAGSDTALSDAEFTLNTADNDKQTVTTDDKGEASFSITKPGTYTLSETKAPAGYQKADDVTVEVERGKDYTVKYDETNKKYYKQYDLIVKIGDKEYKSDQAYTIADQPETKAPETKSNGTAAIKAKKVLEGRDLKEGEFSFTISADEGTPMPAETKVSNRADGTVDFGTVTYDKAGVYTYTIKEVKGDLRGVTYDDSARTVKVTVKEEADGNLAAEVEGAADAVFTNKYVDPDTGDTAGSGKNDDPSHVKDGEPDKGTTSKPAKTNNVKHGKVKKNTHTPGKTVKHTKAKTNTPGSIVKTGDDPQLIGFIALMAGAACAAAALAILKKRRFSK